MAAGAERRCAVCTRVDQFDLIELDTLMGDPSAWPATIWGIFNPPTGDVPASYRRYGAVEMGLDWLGRHGFDDITRTQVRNHYRFDVPKIATNPADLVATGLIARGNQTEVAKLDPGAYLRYYNAGVEVGIKGLGLLQDRIATLQAEGKEVPLALVKLAVDVGSKLAMSQAAIKAAGKPWGDQDDDDGFRAGSAPEPSPRFGHHRIRTIDGEARPVKDMGPADRDRFNERARQEGSPELPSR